MGYQAVFERYELKYMLTRWQKAEVLKAIEPYMALDSFGRSTIRNIYFDTDDYILARHSIAKPDFKEKLRIRSYSRAEADSTVFVELKRKYNHIVYKRRVGLSEKEAMDWAAGAGAPKVHEAEPQMAAEIDFFMETYKGLRPALFLSYEREAYRMRDGSDFRVTFDENILARDEDISLESEVYGERVLDADKVLMELKCSGGIPLWMTHILSELRLYKTSFSKYGTAYRDMIYPAVYPAAAKDAACRGRCAGRHYERRHYGRRVVGAARHATA